ncbi:MAG: PhzF family phenazine biosynthesis protein [Eggerthellaceae bacterium]|nr:PhzF family phenazine biosynthesis protein [Eggerthellaceae bacterium]
MRYFAVDVFTERLFGGNPAGICLLDSWPGDALLQGIAAENNLSETAFLVKQDGYWDLRWFSPKMEVDLCGHATMGSAYVLFNFVERDAQELSFKTASGALSVTRGEGGMLWMDFPARTAEPVPAYLSLTEAFGAVPDETYRSADLLLVFNDEETVEGLSPDFATLRKVKEEASMPSDNFGVIATAPGRESDFVSRFFAPNLGVDEDPVTGRAHCVLTPYWSARLGKKSLTARQLSARRGQLWCEDCGERVRIGGKVQLYLSGAIEISS